jgi:hypothetical protein
MPIPKNSGKNTDDLKYNLSSAPTANKEQNTFEII